MIRECDQTKCSFHKSQGEGNALLCPICDDCKSVSNMVEEDCVNCWNCLKDIGYIRSGSPDINKIRESQAKNEGIQQPIIIRR
jgi:hypothetical protein